MKTWKKRTGLGMAFAAAFAALGTVAAPASKPIEDAESEAIRAKLAPVVEATLSKHCGEDCPSYKVELKMKKAASESIDDLGFSVAAEKPEAKSVAVNVLIQDRVPKAQRQSLSQILSYRVGNETVLPVHVALKPLKAPAPAEASVKTANAVPVNWLEAHGAELIWPACALTLAALAILGMLVYWRNRRAEAHEAFVRSQPKEEKAAESLVEHSAESEALEDLLKHRSLDFAWLIEERAAMGDKAAIRRILSAYSAATLTSEIAISSDALASLAVLSQEPIEKGNAKESLAWISAELDRAHWKRQNEEHRPLAGLQRLSDARLLELFRSLASGPARAAFFCALPQNRWPYLLGHIESEARIQLGTDLHSFQNAGGAERLGAEALVRAGMDRLVGGAGLAPEGTVEDYTLYLSDQEGRSLWQRLATAKRPSLSLEGLLNEMSSEALLEVCLGLDVTTLKTLLPRLSEGARLRILGVLPKTLKERVCVNLVPVKSEGQDSDPGYIRARAQFLGAYRRINGERAQF